MNSRIYSVESFNHYIGRKIYCPECFSDKVHFRGKEYWLECLDCGSSFNSALNTDDVRNMKLKILLENK